MKAQPHREQYLRALAGMSDEQRLQKAFELSDWSRDLFMAGLRERFPELGPDEIQGLYVRRLLRCHNRAS
jgi:hypothetical protein